MNERESAQVIRMVESHFQTDFGTDGRDLWAFELREHDADIATKAVAYLARHGLPNNRARPQLHDYRAVYLKLARDAQIAAQLPQLQVSPMRKPPWVKRWERARAAGDPRPFPEQAPGYEALRREHPLNAEAYKLPHIAHSSREHWVQPDEYLD